MTQMEPEGGGESAAEPIVIYEPQGTNPETAGVRVGMERDRVHDELLVVIEMYWSGGSSERVYVEPESTPRLLAAIREVTGEMVDRDELPFECEWEIGLQEVGETENWDHFLVWARSRDEATSLAQQEARGEGFADPKVINVYGPMKPEDPVRVGEEMIEEVFG